MANQALMANAIRALASLASYQRMIVPDGGGSGHIVCPEVCPEPAGADVCLAGAGSGHGEVDRAGAVAALAGGLVWLAGGVAATFGLGFGFGFSGTACASWVMSGGGGGG